MREKYSEFSGDRIKITLNKEDLDKLARGEVLKGYKTIIEFDENSLNDEKKALW